MQCGIESLGDISWDLAILGGCLSVILHGMGWYARRRLRASLKIPLTEEAEAVTHLRESRAAHWHRIGLALSIFSILCAMGWLVS